jgi:glutathionylspermidine synthase
MRRFSVPARANWRAEAERVGFTFHTSEDGNAYWDESACYAFTLHQIEEDIEAPTAALLDMCYQAVDYVLAREALLERLRIPRFLWDAIAQSWRRRDRDLYGRFDLCYGGTAPVKLYEFNADTPTGLFEASVFQWLWLEASRASGTVAANADQFNSLHERLIDAWRRFGIGWDILHFTCARGSDEDRVTVDYLRDCAEQAGIAAKFLFVDEIGITADDRFTDLEDVVIIRLFKLYPWEWLAAESFGHALARDATRVIEPIWKMILSNKGLLAVLWEMFPEHPLLLPAYFENDPKAASIGERYVRKPLLGREGANIEIVGAGAAATRVPGPYGEEGYVRQALAPLPDFAGNRPVLGSWVIAGQAGGMGIREERAQVTSNTARFVPHIIVD